MGKWYKPHFRKVTPYSSYEDIYLFLVRNLSVPPPRIGGIPALEDWHFSHYVLRSIKTVDDALKMADQLDQECNAMLEHKTGCRKAAALRRLLESPFWTENPKRLRNAIATTRHIICKAHEPISFSLNQYPYDLTISLSTEEERWWKYG